MKTMASQWNDKKILDKINKKHQYKRLKRELMVRNMFCVKKNLVSIVCYGILITFGIVALLNTRIVDSLILYLKNIH